MIIKRPNLSPSLFNLIQILNVSFKINFNITFPYRLHRLPSGFLPCMKFPNYTVLFT